MTEPQPLLAFSPDKGFLVQGLSVLSLCADGTFGDTPFFLYDLDLACGRYQQILDSFAFSWPKTKIHYAMKANYNVDLLRALREKGASIDAVSPAEVILALRLGYRPEDILYTANNMTNDEMRQVQGLGVLFNIDALSGLDRFGTLFPGSEVCVRFNPDVVAGEHKKIQTGGDLTKFGILLEDAPKVVEIAKKHGLKIVGLHEHTGSGIADTDKVLMSINNLLSVGKKEWFPDLRFLDFGGGFKAPYLPDEKRVDYAAFGKVVTARIAEFCKDYGRELFIYFEPGKYVVAECGLFVVRANTLKDNKGRLIVGTDSGFPHLIRPVFYDAYHHVVNLSNPQGASKVYDICGNICETGDRFASDRELPEIREGDYIGILNAGAYCMAMASVYNLRALPAEYVVQGEKVRLSRARKTAEALVDEIIAAA